MCVCVCVGGGGVEREKEGKNQWELQSGTISGLAEEEPDCQNEAGSLLNGEWESTRRKLGWRGGGGGFCVSGCRSVLIALGLQGNERRPPF